MANELSSFAEHSSGEKRWYDLFSRGARDWLRHSDKVNDAVRRKLPELLSRIDVLGPRPETTVRIPVHFLEHYRFRLRHEEQLMGVGQGKGKPGDTLVAPSRDRDDGKGGGGNEEGGYQFVLELKIEDIVDWLWEELKLPHLKRKEGRVRDADYLREGWNRRGVRSRLDRRRSMKEAIKRRGGHGERPAFTDEDLRYRQLVMRKQPATEAVVFFAMDVSSSMTEEDRRLAKTFFFWVVQGLRRQYVDIHPVFIAHTEKAWEFAEDEFFQVAGSGGTVASTAFDKALGIIDERFDPSRYNIYLFYASDGENFIDDAGNAARALREVADLASYTGYVETVSGSLIIEQTEMSRIFGDLMTRHSRVGTYALRDPDSVWSAIRVFFTEQAGEAEVAP